MKLTAYISLFFCLPFFGQNNLESEEHNLTDSYQKLVNDGLISGGWGIGNACGIDYRLIARIDKTIDMEGGVLQVLNSHIKIYGDVINVATIEYLCDNAILEIKSGALSVPEMDVNKALVYPNPFVSEIHIKNIEVRTLKLFDVTGRLLKDYVTVGQLHRIVVSDLKSGVYFLRINDFITKKLVKL